MVRVAPLDGWTVAPALGVVDRREAFAGWFCRALRTHADAADAARSCRGWLNLPDAPPGAQPSSIESQVDVPLGADATSAAPRPIVIIPGMFGECVAPWTTPFSDAYPLLRARGHRIHVLDVEGRSSSAKNGRAIDAWMRSQAEALDDMVVIAYSKGATDFMHGAVLDAGDRRWMDRIAALVTVAGVVNGTPLAAEWAERVETWLAGIDLPSCGAGDGGAVDSQTYEAAGQARAAYLAMDRLPATFGVVAVTDEASANPLLRAFYRHLADLDARNDAQVLMEDALLPGSQLVAIARADHWSIALPFETSDVPLPVLGHRNHFPRVSLLVALLDFVAASDA